MLLRVGAEDGVELLVDVGVMETPKASTSPDAVVGVLSCDIVEALRARVGDFRKEAPPPRLPPNCAVGRGFPPCDGLPGLVART